METARTLTTNALLLALAAPALLASPGVVTAGKSSWFTSQGNVTSGDGISVGGSTGSNPGVGTLTVSDSATVSATSVSVNGSGTLTGNGTVNAPVTINGGTLAPGPGTLTIGGNLTFTTTSSNMRCTVSSTRVDNVQVSGAATLSGKLSVTVNSTGDFTLLHAAGGLGSTTFTSYSFTYNGCFSASVEYRNNSDGSSDVILHVVATCD